MDFVLTDDQQALGGLVRAIVDGRFTLERVRRREGEPDVVDPDDWAALAEAGVFSLTVPEAAGGAGLGFADAAVVFEELGRGLVPGPLVASMLAAHLGAEATDGAASAGAATDDAATDGAAGALAGAADGSLVVGSSDWCDWRDWRDDHDGSSTDSDRLVLIEHLGALGKLVTVAPDARGNPQLVAVDPAGLAGRAVERSLDPLTPLWQVEAGRAARAIEAGTVVGDDTRARRWRRDAQVLTGALCVGLAAATCDLAVAYARSRHQFGRPIGSFQAVKHLCADMLVRVETARASVQAAAVTIDQPEVGDAARAAAGAALLATEAATLNSRTCIQVHGGMGFTWDVPAHLYLMRAKVLASSLGPPERLAAAVAERY